MLLRNGQVGFDPVIIEGENCLSKQERAEYDRLDTECLREAKKIMNSAVKTGKSWREISADISGANRERYARMLSILENARRRDDENRMY